MSADNDHVLLQWSTCIRMLFSRQMWKTFFILFGITLALIGILLSVVSKPEDGLIAFFGGLAVFGVLWIITGIVVDLFGGFGANYLVTVAGIGFSSGKGTRATVDTVAVLGALTGNTGMLASGLLAQAEQDIFIAWADIARVSVFEGSRYIEVRSKRAIKPLGMYCEDHFTAMRDLLRDRAPAGTPGV